MSKWGESSVVKSIGQMYLSKSFDTFTYNEVSQIGNTFTFNEVNFNPVFSTFTSLQFT